MKTLLYIVQIASLLFSVFAGVWLFTYILQTAPFVSVPLIVALTIAYATTRRLKNMDPENFSSKR